MLYVPEESRSIREKRLFINLARVPTVLQREPWECGAAALEMVFAYHDKLVPWKALLDETVSLTPDGQKYCTGGDLMRAAMCRGYDCHGYRRDASQLRFMEMPCIVHLNQNHFAVLEGFQDNRVFINDPRSGRRELSMAQMEKEFTGIVLTLARQEDA